MTQLRIPIPHELERFVHRQVEGGAYSSAGDFVCALIREARSNAARRILEEVHRNYESRRRAVPGSPEP